MRSSITRHTLIVFILVTIFSGCDRSNYSGISPDTINTNSARLKVVDSEFGRQLVINDRVKGFVDTTTWNSRLKYGGVLDLPLHYFVGSGKMFLIGLGTGSIPKSYRRRGWEVDVVEPESAVIHIARRSFGFSDSGVQVRNDDGRRFLEGSNVTYDVVIVDEISSMPPRPHLLTKEFFQIVARHLRDGGIIAAAIESFGWNDAMVTSLAATLGGMFQHVIVLPIAEPPNRFGSIVVLASNRTLDNLLQDLNHNEELDPDWRFSPDYQKTHAWDNHFTPDTRSSVIQYDASNSWQEFFGRINDPARRDSVGYFP